MSFRSFCFFLLIFFVSACSGRKEAPPAETPVSTQAEAAPTTEGDFIGLPLSSQRGEWFTASGICVTCHTQMVDQVGADVSTDKLWRATMMANAARDPYWQAAVRAETTRHAKFSQVIEDKCATCHMPMARFTLLHSQGSQAGYAPVLDSGFASTEHLYHELAMDGVSCNLCHQIQPNNFGEPESFSGGYQIDLTLPKGEREAFGPYAVDGGWVAVMQGVSGFIPVEAAHIEQSELCGVCHTLYTPFIDSAGVIGGQFPEQMVYLEWKHSRYPAEKSCQGCHMPVAQGGVQLSVTGGPLRSPFYQHVFSGGNVYMAKMLRENAFELQLTASSSQLAGAATNAAEQLQRNTATLVLQNAKIEDDTLMLEISVQSRVGHKFPSGFPSRRAWLHVVAKDAVGKLVFESGGVADTGTIHGNDNDADPTRIEPHYNIITSSDQVQVYEAIMGDTEGKVTTSLLSGAGYLKDNRLLPIGFEKSSASSDIAVQGQAADDEDFQGGGDLISYTIPLNGSVIP